MRFARLAALSGLSPGREWPDGGSLRRASRSTADCIEILQRLRGNWLLKVDWDAEVLRGRGTSPKARRLGRATGIRFSGRRAWQHAGRPQIPGALGS